MDAASLVRQVATRHVVQAATLFGAETAAETGRGVRLVVELTDDTPHRFRRADLGGGRSALSVRFDDASLAPGLRVEHRRVQVGGLESLALRSDAAGAELELELTPGVETRMFVAEGPRRLVVDVVPPAAGRAAPLVLIDPGHGGNDRGSPGLFGLWEGDVALDVSRRVRAWLARLSPETRAQLTREEDVSVSLDARAAMANALGASLFVSIHLNAADRVVERGGVTTFVLDTQNQRNVLRLAANENGGSTREVTPLQFLVGSLARAEQRERSERLAHAIQEHTVRAGRRFVPHLRDRGVRSAMFSVLVGAIMPAVLVEGAFLTQPDEAMALAEPAYRDALAGGIARGIHAYLTAR